MLHACCCRLDGGTNPTYQLDNDLEMLEITLGKLTQAVYKTALLTDGKENCRV